MVSFCYFGQVHDVSAFAMHKFGSACLLVVVAQEGEAADWVMAARAPAAVAEAEESGRVAGA